MKPSGIITLTTDFGLSDPYVAMMKGVILSINPDAQIVDLSHRVKAGAIFQAAGLIQEAYPFFPEGTIHVAVVDPGVGGDRRPIAVKTVSHLFAGPDNGLFWPIIASHQGVEVIHLKDSSYFLPHISATFHGRDIFAPVAAHLSVGVGPIRMGPTITDPVRLKFPKPQEKGDILLGQIVRVDRFGNLITDIHRENLDRFLGRQQPIVRIGNLIVEGVQSTYSDVKEGETLALIGSSNCLEISVNLGRASDRLDMDSEAIIGIEVQVARSKGSLK